MTQEEEEMPFVFMQACLFYSTFWMKPLKRCLLLVTPKRVFPLLYCDIVRIGIILTDKVTLRQPINPQAKI